MEFTLNDTSNGAKVIIKDSVRRSKVLESKVELSVLASDGVVIVEDVEITVEDFKRVAKAL